MRPDPRRSIPLLVLAALVAACGTNAPAGATLDAGQTDAESDAVDTPEPLDTGDDDAEGDAPDDSGPDDTTPDAQTDAAGADIGSPCDTDADCLSSLCIDVIVGPGGGICTIPCLDDAQCGDGFDCVLVTNSGGDAVQVCVPLNLCVDADGDTFGAGPGCAGPDCNDDDANTRPGALETCNGQDDDCNGVTDTDSTGLGDPCVTSFAGICAEGTQTCQSGVPSCEPTRTATAETCNTLDDDCDGALDEAAGCYPGGAPCDGDVDCASGLCVEGLCWEGACNGPCPDRALLSSGGAEGLRSESFSLDVSFGVPMQAAPLGSENYTLRLGPAAFRAPR